MADHPNDVLGRVTATRPVHLWIATALAALPTTAVLGTTVGLHRGPAGPILTWRGAAVRLSAPARHVARNIIEVAQATTRADDQMVDLNAPISTWIRQVPSGTSTVTVGWIAWGQPERTTPTPTPTQTSTGTTVLPLPASLDELATHLGHRTASTVEPDRQAMQLRCTSTNGNCYTVPVVDGRLGPARRVTGKVGPDGWMHDGRWATHVSGVTGRLEATV